MKLVTAAQMRSLEQAAAAAGISPDALMANAGLAVAQEVWMLLGHLEQRRIVVLVGPGHNGGDGLVAARRLAEWDADVHCVALRRRDDSQWRATVEAGIPCLGIAEDDPACTHLDALLDGAACVVDALLGAGTSRPISGDLREMLTRLRAARERRRPPRLVAVDLPSGVDPDSGRADPATVGADLTVTFEFPKVGLYVQPGAGLAGRVQAVEIGIPREAWADLPLELLDRRAARALLPPRPADANKGAFGRVLVAAGCWQYPGASVLACLGAYRAGAGLVTLATEASLVPALVAAMPEVTYLPLGDRHDPGVIGAVAVPDLRRALPRYDALLVGCGLGQDPATQAFVRQIIRDAACRHLTGLVIDADGLNALAGQEWSLTLTAPTIVTPHPGEMARLLGREIAAIQADRLGAALETARAWNVVVVLKGANTVIAAPDGRARLSAVAHAGLATAGTGDVLAGAIAGLLAQGLSPYDAAALGVFLHAEAGVRAASAQGTAGMTARDVLAHLPRAGRALAGEEPRPPAGLAWDGSGRTARPGDSGDPATESPGDPFGLGESGAGPP